ncbi:hypothetical protein HC891_00865 [Candidatus Gracilibacteria bacterium]|nr:hypothetical protein [Candidatus Gracilibacteria bacterium]
MPTTVDWRGSSEAEQSILVYWFLSAALAFLFLGDWIGQWNISATWSNSWLVAWLIATFAIGQFFYLAVAHSDGRSLYFWPAALFVIGNGIFETFAFALVYKAGALIGSSLMHLFWPQAANIAGFSGGLLSFIIYGGLIHALFWLHLLPPHLDDAPRSRVLRKVRPLAEIALVIGWSLCFWLYQDIWTVIFFHLLVDIGLVLLVRPPLFTVRR